MCCQPDKTKQNSFNGKSLCLDLNSVMVERKIEEKKLSSKEIEKEYSLLSKAFQLSFDGIIMGKPNGEITYINDAILTMFGTTDKTELIGKNVIEFIAKSEFERALQISSRSIETGKGYLSQFTAIKKDVSEVLVEVDSAVIKSENGDAIGFIDIVRDVTERKKAEESMKKQAILIDLCSSAVIAKTSGGTITFWNKGAEKLYGYTKVEAIGQNVNSLLRAKYQETNDSIINQLKQGKHWIGEIIHYSKQNEAIIVQADWIATTDEQGNVLEILESNVDITELKKVQKRLEKSEEKFRKAFALSPIAISIYNITKNEFVDCNESFELLTGYSREEIIGHNSFDINFWKHPVDRNQIFIDLRKEDYAQIKGLELTSKSCETRIVDASFFTVEINGDLHSISNIMDITERQKAEKELQENHLQLENLTGKMKVLGSLTRHDVKNKLMVANNNAYLLKKKLVDKPELLAYVHGIELALKQSDRIFEFSYIYEKVGSEKLHIVNVEECFNLAFSLIGNSKLKVTNSCQGLSVMGDSMLSQLFYNLIDNSLKHGKNVTEIKVYYKSEPSSIKLYFEDNGVGIPQVDKDKIFSEGFTTGGSGLGLKLVKKMIESYCWTIKESGTPSKGAIFEIAIPKSALFF